MHTEAGFTLVELLLAMVLAAILLAGLTGVTGQITQVRDSVTDRNALNRQARQAMEHISRAVGHSHYLMLPFHDVTSTGGITENIHTVLAVTLDRTTDLDGDGTPDADNDGDGRFDEDPPADRTNDAATGIYLVDDDVDGTVDEGADPASDDESAAVDDDPVDGVDDDADQNTDEDPAADMNADACPGVCGVDDDGDGSVDEGFSNDDNDDEDGATDEDWLDPVVFRLNGSQLVMRTPVPWDEDGDADVDGRDFVESVIADNVSQFRVERLADRLDGTALVDITLALTGPVRGETVSIATRLRVGGAL